MHLNRVSEFELVLTWMGNGASMSNSLEKSLIILEVDVRLVAHSHFVPDNKIEFMRCYLLF